MGTNTDPYQQCEGRYRLTRGIVETLGRARNPFSILTKSTMIQRDLDVLVAAAERTDVRVNFSIGTLDEEVWRISEPGTPPPWRRVEALARLTEAGLPCGVLVAPILPGLSDGEEQLSAGRAGLRRGGRGLDLEHRPAPAPRACASCSCRGSQRERPDLVERYDELYGARNGYLARDEQRAARRRACARSSSSTAGARAARCCRAAFAPAAAPPRRSRPRRSRSCASSADEARARVSRHAAAEPRHAVLRAGRAPRARAPLRQPRVHARRSGPHPPALRHAALDRVPAGVPRLGARPEAAARPLHRALLPRRGDGVRRRPSPVRALPPRRLRAPGRDLARAPSRARPAPTRSTSSCTASASRRTRGRSCHHRAPLGDLPDGAFVLRDGEPWLVRGSELARWTPAGYAERIARPRARRRDRDHAALAGGRAARRMGAARAALPSLDRDERDVRDR